LTARITVLPSARRLIDSLRDIGYDLPAAVADIVDNSIAASASRIDVTFRFAGLNSWVCIADNGRGMAGKVLDEAMRYGSRRNYSSSALGQFGLGLKTASLSQCRRLTVASRQSKSRRRIAIRRWDVDDVARSDRWEVLQVTESGAPAELVDPLRRRRGTVVMWENLDRLLDYRLPNGAAAESGLRTIALEVRDHLAMVFHRFLTGEARRGRKVRITLNGSDVPAWDPFARIEPETRALDVQSIPFVTNGRRRWITVRPYILPPQHRFSSAAAHARAAGPAKWNRQQGFYFYRSDRLVQGGGWNRLRTTDEHTKLARVCIDLPPGAERAFGLNVAKMRVTVPRDLRNELMAIASGVATQASINYRSGGQQHSHPARAQIANGQPPVARLIDSIDAESIDALRMIAGLLRDEFATEPDVLRRALSRVDRLSLTEGQALSVSAPRTRLRRPRRQPIVLSTS
jgi:hypothetical protein